MDMINCHWIRHLWLPVQCAWGGREPQSQEQSLSCDLPSNQMKSTHQLMIFSWFWNYELLGSVYLMNNLS